MSTKTKLILALILAFAAWYMGYTWLGIIPFIVLFGMNGSRWVQVNYIPNESDDKGIVYFNKDGNRYRNSQGTTHKMVERGKDTWASPSNWKGGKQ